MADAEKHDRQLRRELAGYGGEVAEARVESIIRDGDLFRVGLGGRRVEARRLLVTTGARDELPDLPGPGGSTPVPGLFVAGNIADVQAQVISAAAAGLMAGAAINTDLIMTDAAAAAGAINH